jgi:hypothetical protein
VVLVLAVSACSDEAAVEEGGFPGDAFAFAASSDLAVGVERLLVAVSDPVGTRLPSPSIAVDVTVWPEGREGETQTQEAGFIWAIPDVSGLYRAEFDFDTAGIWMVSVEPHSGPALDVFPVAINQSPLTVAVGDPAPRSNTLTSSDAPLEEISTATDPDPSFYLLSVADAVTSGAPTVIAFATPKFCQTAICGPTLERLQEIAPDFPEVNFIHVEVFTNLDDPENLEVVPAVVEWGLPTEPWVFVVDSDGIVTARFEGVVSAEEIAAALAG